jgi:CRP-like cAMP-binding protein
MPTRRLRAFGSGSGFDPNQQGHQHMKITTSMRESTARFTNGALVSGGAINGRPRRLAREVDFRSLLSCPSNLNKNRLLARLPKECRDRIAPNLKMVTMPLGEVVYQVGDPERYVYFPVDAIVSLLCAVEDGKSAETSVVGNDGVVGIAAALGGGNTSIRAVVQSAGTAFRLPSLLFQQAIDRSCELRQLILRYTQALITQICQTAVCNRHHTIERQLCRRLLLSLDRLPGDEMVFTQELIASTLGVRRESVTTAAGKLIKLGVIECRRGHVKVLSRDMLEELSCECYSVVKCETERLLAG